MDGGGLVCGKQKTCHGWKLEKEVEYIKKKKQTKITNTPEMRKAASLRLHNNKLNNKIYNIDLIDPEDNIYYGPIDGVATFARNHGLDRIGLNNLLLGKIHQHKGWKIYSV